MRLLFDAPESARIFLFYSLSMVPAWPDVIDYALALLGPAGELHIVDFGGQERLPQWFKASLRGRLALFHVIPRDHLESVLPRRDVVLSVERSCLGYVQPPVCRRS